MKITGVKTYKVFANWRNWVFIKIETDEGIHGVGEGTLEGRAATVETAIGEMARKLVDRDPFQIEDIWQSIYYRETFWVGGPILLTALSCIEMALWDIVGKKLNTPIYNLLGGKCHDPLRFYANGWYFGAETPEDFARKAVDVVNSGYTAMKWDPFGTADRTMTSTEFDNAVNCVREVRGAVGDGVDLLIEVHGRLNVYTAIRMARALEPYNIFLYEEPVPPDNLDALALGVEWERFYKLAKPHGVHNGKAPYEAQRESL